MMSVLEIYINWVNSVLGEAGGHVDGVEAVQDGKVLCELIDVLAPDAGLQAKVKASGDCTPLAYINAALEHMKSHGIKIKFPAEDIVHNEIKSMLDVLWILILNYGIHFIGQNAFQRSVGIGKKNLLEWCQEELDTTFDSRNTLTFNLCNGNWFLKLLEKVAGCSMQKSEDKTEYIDALLIEIQDRYLIKKDIIKANDIVDGTVDEHTLMIYLSLLKRRVSNSERHSRREMYSTDGKAAAMAKIHYFEQRARSLSSDSQRSKSADSARDVIRNYGRSNSAGGRSSSANSDRNQHRNRSRSLYDQVIGDENETSDWSSTGSLVSGRDKASPKQHASPQQALVRDDLLHQTISERVMESLPEAGSDKDGEKEMESQRISEKETDTLSEFSSSSLSREKSSSDVHHGSSRTNETNGNPKVATADGSGKNVIDKRTFSDGHGKSSVPAVSNFDHSSGKRMSPSQDKHYYHDEMDGKHESLRKPEESQRNRSTRDENLRIRIRRPKDYIRQWEDTMDRLSNVSVSDEFGSPRAPLISSYNVNIPSRSRSSEVNGSASKSFAPANAYRRSHVANLRSRSSDDTPHITISSSDSPRIKSSFANTNGAISATPERSSRNNGGLESILDRLPEHMRHQAQEASKFLMHTSGPEVIALIEAIKKARENVHTSMPNDSQRVQRARPINSNDTSDQTILKRREHTESSPSGSRVRFQPTFSKSQGTGELQSQTLRSSAPPATASTASPRVHSSSPRRRAVNSSGFNGDGERGSDTMLSISPRDRSRSLSPRISTAAGIEYDSRSSPKPSQSQETMSSVSQPLREELLLKNLGLNTRVVEEERPSSRLKALTSSPRISSVDSPGRMYTSSPRKPLVERLPLHKAYPEVTRLDLGLDSDRSYLDDRRDDSPPPIRRGGAGRVPRREAWEQERRRKEEVSVTGSRTDSAAQSRFIDVLCKEIEKLKQKVELMEEDGVRRSLSRHSRSPSATGNIRLSSAYTAREIRDENSHMLLAPRLIVPTYPGRGRATSCPLLQISSRSAATRSSPRSATVTRSHDTGTSLKQPAPPYQGTASSSGISASHGRTASPQTQNSISLGYSSPARCVTPEIWGNDLNVPDGFETDRQEKWKELISRRNLSEGEVIELKQALACAVVENDILQAKLNNARHEIHDKLQHTNSVLDDCRRHLAKAQAENMELRTMLEQEKQRSEAYESRIKELENSVFEVKTDNQQLENELDQTATLLDRSLTETKPSVDALKAEKAKLISRLASVENDNDSLREEVHGLKRSQAKAMNTMDELRECLSKVRRERQELFDELTTVQRREQNARVREIISNYQEKGARDEHEREQDLTREWTRPYFELPDSDEGIYSSSQASGGQHFRSSSFRSSNRSFDDSDVLLLRSSRNKTLDASFSPRQVTPRRSSSQQRFDSSFDLSPTHYREIYPHRKSYTPRSRSCSPHRNGQRSLSVGRNSPSGYNESFLDQTLREIEDDMKRERQKLVSNSTSLAQRRLRFSSCMSDNSQVTSPSFSSKSRSPGRNTGMKSSVGVSSSRVSAQRTSTERLNRSFNSVEDLRHKRSRSSSPTCLSPRPSILKANDRGESLTGLRSRSPSYTRQTGSSYSSNRSRDSSNRPSARSLSMEGSQSPRYFPRADHSPPTRLSPDDKEKRKPLHAKSGVGEIARNLQREFDKEDAFLNSMSKSAVFQNKSWFEMQSESDGDDTGINSSMSSRSSCERPVTRKKTPLLSDEQRRYADELIQKYTGNRPLK